MKKKKVLKLVNQVIDDMKKEVRKEIRRVENEARKSKKNIEDATEFLHQFYDGVESTQTRINTSKLVKKSKRKKYMYIETSDATIKDVAKSVDKNEPMNKWIAQ